MRICIVAPKLNTFGGAERVIISDANQFTDAGHSVHIITEDVDPTVASGYGLPESTRLHTYSIPDSNLVPSIYLKSKCFREIFKTVDPDVLIAHYEEKPTWLALSTISTQSTFITHVHGSILWFENEIRRVSHNKKNCFDEIIDSVPGHKQFWDGGNTSFYQKFKSDIYEKIERTSLQSSDAVFVNTNQVAKELDCLYDVDAIVNPPGIEKKALSLDQCDADFEDSYIFSVSRLDPRKRIKLLIDSFTKLYNDIENYKLLIGGSGDQAEELKGYVSDRGMSDIIDFAGFIDEESLPAYYSAADIFACPGWMSYGLTPLEAVRSGTPVALSSDAFVKEVIGNKDGVRIIPPNVDSWNRELRKMIENKNSPSKSDIPTAAEHSNKKIEIIKSEHDKGSEKTK